MNQSTVPLFTQGDENKYIIIKIPRDAVRDYKTDSPVLGTWESMFRRGIWIALCVVSLLLGIIVGSFLHPSLYSHLPDKAVWKSSSLTPIEGK